MLRKLFILPIILSALIFVSMGDKFLPEPLSSASLNTRTSINDFLISLFPQKEFTNPYERTEDAIDRQNRKTDSK